MKCPSCGAEINDNAAVCSQCNYSLKLKKVKLKKTPQENCWLAPLSLGCCAIGIVGSVYVAANLSENSIFFFGSVSLIPMSILLGIWALIRIYRSNKTLGGKRTAIASIALSSFILGYVIAAGASMQMPSELAEKTVCMSFLKSLGMAIAQYAEAHDQQLPEAEHWCDVLIAEDEYSSLHHFRCPSSEDLDGESSYVLNKSAAGMKWSDLPPKMVLLFEAKNENDGEQGRRWNRVGGPESLRLGNHEDGCNILFADGSVYFVPLAELPELRWSMDHQAEDREVIEELVAAYEAPANKPKPLIKAVALAAIGLLVLVGTIIILRKYGSREHLVFALVLGVLSAGAGGFLGLLAEMLYPRGDVPRVGMYVGAIAGLLVGLCYAVILTSLPADVKRGRGFKGYAASVGMLAGVICSTMVHLILMLVYGETSPMALLAGMPYGVLAGAILGRNCGDILRKSVASADVSKGNVEDDYRA